MLVSTSLAKTKLEHLIEDCFDKEWDQDNLQKFIQNEK